MVNELKQAIDKAEKLSVNDQQAIARLILDEIEWSQTFRDSQNNLVTLAEEAISELPDFIKESQKGLYIVEARSIP